MQRIKEIQERKFSSLRPKVFNPQTSNRNTIPVRKVTNEVSYAKAANKNTETGTTEAQIQQPISKIDRLEKIVLDLVET